MSVATGVGSMPGEDATAYDEAVRIVLDSVPDLPYLPELPGRGAVADMTGRALAVVSGLGADLQPAGWRLTAAAGTDQRRARSLLAQDLDSVEERAEGLSGRFKVQVTGPWTLAATVERPRGDRVLADHGARRELAQSLAEGVGEHIADLRRRLPAASLVVQIDEPALARVLAAQIPTASGFSRHRAVDAPEASPALEWVLSAVAAAGASSVVHCCAADPPLALLTGAGAQGVSVDLSALDVTAYDEIGHALENGRSVFLGVVPTSEPNPRPSHRGLTERVLRLLDMLGFDPEAAAGQLVITPACGLATASPAWARRALELSRQVAAGVLD